MYDTLEEMRIVDRATLSKPFVILQGKQKKKQKKAMRGHLFSFRLKHYFVHDIHYFNEVKCFMFLPQQACHQNAFLELHFTFFQK